MDIKELFKPSKEKLILLIILIFLSFASIYHNEAASYGISGLLGNIILAISLAINFPLVYLIESQYYTFNTSSLPIFVLIFPMTLVYNYIVAAVLIKILPIHWNDFLKTNRSKLIISFGTSILYILFIYLRTKRHCDLAFIACTIGSVSSMGFYSILSCCQVTLNKLIISYSLIFVVPFVMAYVIVSIVQKLRA